MPTYAYIIGDNYIHTCLLYMNSPLIRLPIDIALISKNNNINNNKKIKQKIKKMMHNTRKISQTEMKEKRKAKKNKEREG